MREKAIGETHFILAAFTVSFELILISEMKDQMVCQLLNE